MKDVSIKLKMLKTQVKKDLNTILILTNKTDEPNNIVIISLIN